MGCWNENIFGGDNALEWRENIYSMCNAEEYDSETMGLKPIPIETLESNLSKIIEALDQFDREGEDRNIGYIVLASIMMNSGLEIEESIKNNIINAIDNDDWSKTNQVRKMVMRNYKKTISEYSPENPINIENINLLDEKEPSGNELLEEDFRQIFGIFKARIAKLKRSIDEKSGVKEYDEGFKDAVEEEIDFLTEFKELFEKYEQFAILQEKIEEGMTNGFSGVGGSTGTGGIAGSSRGKVSGGGNDVVAG